MIAANFFTPLLNNEDDFSVETSGDGKLVTITGFKESQCYENLRIPAKIGGMPVIGIGNTAFCKEQITSVDIQDGVASIGSYAFKECGLTRVRIPDNAHIGDKAFSENHISHIIIGNNVTIDGDGGFDPRFLKLYNQHKKGIYALNEWRFQPM